MTPSHIKKALRPYIPKVFFTGWKWLRFFYMQRSHGFDVPDKPLLDKNGLLFFENELKRCEFYLEYGCGGSTVLAAKLGKEFVSVDNDRYFMNSVMKKIGPAVQKDAFVHSDTGLSGPWGFPLFKGRTPKRLNKWKNYPEAPWPEIQKRNKKPDLVLIDGRFRVACALTCLKQLADSPDATIVVDDYRDRTYYREIERFARLGKTHGRMASFHPKPCDTQDLNASILRFQADWR